MCVPPASPSYVRGDEQLAKGPASSEHRNVASGSASSKRNVAVATLELPGASVIVGAGGGASSTAHDTDAASDRLPAPSTAHTSKA